MANFVTVAFGNTGPQTQMIGIVTRLESTSGELPALTVSGDPWINVTGLNPHPVVGDHYDGAAFTLNHADGAVAELYPAQGAKIAGLRNTATVFLRTGFWFNLQLPGDSAPHDYWYPCESTDQSNVHLAGVAALAEADPDTHYMIWNALGNDKDSLTEWFMREHSIANVLEVSRMMQLFVSNALKALSGDTIDTLQTQSLESVDEIVFTGQWPLP